MSYRDDVDTLYSRALLLQRELDNARAEISELRGRRAETSPGIQEIRELPDPLEAHERLIDTSDLDDLPPKPMPDWDHIVNARVTTPMPSPRSLVERVREGVALLNAEDLILVAKIVDEFTDGKGNDETLRARLRWLASELAVMVR